MHTGDSEWLRDFGRAPFPLPSKCFSFFERPKIPVKDIILCNRKVSEAITERELAPTIIKVFSGKLLAKIEKNIQSSNNPGCAGHLGDLRDAGGLDVD